MTEPTVSALIIAKNEAAQLPGCLDALMWADEIIVVVDAASGDETEAIARARGCRVVLRAFDGFANQRNSALAMATGDWVLAVDADERVTPRLAAEIRTRLRAADGACEAFRVPIRSRVFGRAFRFSGTQHDLPVRLFQRTSGRWTGAVHETVEFQGRLGTLRGHMTHETHETLREFLDKLNHYTELEARELAALGHRGRAFDLTLRPLWTFCRLYFGKLGFLDGRGGFLFCALSAVSTAVRNEKLREYSEAVTRLPEHARPAAALRAARSAS